MFRTKRGALGISSDGLERYERLVLTASEATSNHSFITKGTAMSEHSNRHDTDSRADAAAIFCIILLVVATAVFWVSHQ